MKWDAMSWIAVRLHWKISMNLKGQIYCREYAISDVRWLPVCMRVCLLCMCACLLWLWNYLLLQSMQSWLWGKRVYVRLCVCLLCVCVCLLWFVKLSTTARVCNHGCEVNTCTRMRGCGSACYAMCVCLFALVVKLSTCSTAEYAIMVVR
jgi:hypothetical protein